MIRPKRMEIFLKYTESCYYFGFSEVLSFYILTEGLFLERTVWSYSYAMKEQSEAEIYSEFL